MKSRPIKNISSLEFFFLKNRIETDTHQHITTFCNLVPFNLLFGLLLLPLLFFRPPLNVRHILLRTRGILLTHNIKTLHHHHLQQREGFSFFHKLLHLGDIMQVHYRFSVFKKIGTIKSN